MFVRIVALGCIPKYLIFSVRIQKSKIKPEICVLKSKIPYFVFLENPDLSRITSYIIYSYSTQ